MTMLGVPAGGLNTIGQIDATNPLVFYAGQDGMEIAVALCSTHTAGAPVVDADGRYLGFINEFDVMKMLDMGRNLSTMRAEQIMRKDRHHLFDANFRCGEADGATWGRWPPG